MTSDGGRTIPQTQPLPAGAGATFEELLRRNERIWAGFRHIEISLIGAQSLQEVVTTLTRQIPALFPGVTCVTLACLDPEYEMTRLLKKQPGDDPVASFIALTREQLQTLFAGAVKPVLGECAARQQALLFPDYSQPLGSLAAIPLLLRGQLIGALNQGSLDARHFNPSSATDLIEHLAAVTAICIDSAINYERRQLDGLTDALTGVANRRFFERRLREEISRWQRHRATLSCLLLDIDHFKQVNDRYGHQAGDRVLCRVADALSGQLRSGDVLARYGGEEFVLLLPATSPAEAQQIAERLRLRIAATSSPGERNDRGVTVSIGLACLDQVTTVPDDPGAWLIEQADTALYQAKRSGRNRVAVAPRQT